MIHVSKRHADIVFGRRVDESARPDLSTMQSEYPVAFDALRLAAEYLGKNLSNTEAVNPIASTLKGNNVKGIDTDGNSVEFNEGGVDFSITAIIDDEKGWGVLFSKYGCASFGVVIDGKDSDNEAAA